MEASICGAKTRAGTPCKRSPGFNGRYNLHGGKSLLGPGHPNFKTGKYSKYLLFRIVAELQEASDHNAAPLDQP